MNTKLKQNISLSYVYNFFMQLNITSAIWVLYLAFKGMSLVEIGILESIYHITGLILELPTGAVADLYGRKFSIILGRAVNVISCILMITSNSFMGFALSFILSSAAMNLNSGSAEALVFDSLKELGEEEKYKKIWGQLSFVMSIAQGIAILLGGILADVKFLYAYIVGTVIQTVALIISFNFNEPPVQEQESNDDDKLDKHENILVNQVKTSINVLKNRKVVFYTIMFSSLMGSLQTTVFFYSQQYFSDMSYTKTMIAIICAFGSFIEAISSKYSYMLEKKLKLKGVLIFITAFNMMALAGLAFLDEFSVFFYLLTSVAGGISFTIFSDYINTRIPSQYRATILSFDSLCFSIFMIGLFPLFGLSAEHMGFSITFGMTAIIYIPAIIFLTKKLTGHNKEELKEKRVKRKQSINESTVN